MCETIREHSRYVGMNIGRAGPKLRYTRSGENNWSSNYVLLASQLGNIASSPVEQAGGDVHGPLLGLVPLPRLAGVGVSGQVVLQGRRQRVAVEQADGEH